MAYSLTATLTLTSVWTGYMQTHLLGPELAGFGSGKLVHGALTMDGCYDWSGEHRQVWAQ